MSKILVIGETCVDEFIYCETNRLCPEAPVPVVIPKKKINNHGMSGNVVENIRSLSNHANITHIHQKNLITKTRYIDNKSNHMFLRVDDGEDKIDKLEEIYGADGLKEFDIVIVSDYNKGFLSDNDLIYIGKNSNLSILDSKRLLNNDIIKSFSFVKLNEKESINNINLYRENIIVTLGKYGCMFRNDVFMSPKPQETIDVSGAGDTFTTSFILKYYETKDMKTSLEFANEMSGIVVSKRGVSVPI